MCITGSSIFYVLWQQQTASHASDHAAIVANAVFWGAVGALGLVTFAALFAALRRGASDRALLAGGCTLCTLGAALCVDTRALPLTLPRFVAGMSLAWGVGYPAAQATAVSAFSKVLRPQHLGAFLAYQTMAGSAGRVVGPLLAGALYDGAAGGACVAIAAGSCAACCALVAALWRQLRRV